jgi:hypothetical protein
MEEVQLDPTLSLARLLCVAGSVARALGKVAQSVGTGKPEQEFLLGQRQHLLEQLQDFHE